MTLRTVPLGELIRSAATRRAGSEDLPVLSMTMQHGLVDQGTKFRKRVASNDTSQYKRISKGQLVVGFPIDEGVLSIQRMYDAALVSPAYGVWDLRKPDEIEPRYLERFLRSPRALSYYTAKLRGSTARRRTLPTEVFLAVPVPVPYLDVQRRILAILDQADSLRIKRRQFVAKLQDLTQSTFLKTFGDPVSNPHGWSRVPLDALLHAIESGKSPTCSARVALQDEWGVLKLGAVSRGTFDEGENKAFLGDPGTLLKYKVEEGDFLFVRKNTRDLVGTVALVENLSQRLSFPDLMFRFKLHDSAVSSVYLRSLLMCARKRAQIKELANGSSGSMPNISKAKLQNLPIELPPRELQADFETRINVINRSIEKQLSAEESHDLLFQSLQADAFQPSPLTVP